ncbi:hypothetical protein K402DRAFT_439175 [Aulographum hederae CBS 113979]|uniref:Uncharacterized protein n=1 Tax=Aulographum hederae CBS 113979 TaxID=1176131 RepID=A0A6G1GLY8_9PEZI|nr:hypothetical protein K402DRAFT_439175 [Aulographum hederae CBS 113979]
MSHPESRILFEEVRVDAYLVNRDIFGDRKRRRTPKPQMNFAFHRHSTTKNVKRSGTRTNLSTEEVLWDLEKFGQDGVNHRKLLRKEGEEMAGSRVPNVQPVQLKFHPSCHSTEVSLPGGAFLGMPSIKSGNSVSQAWRLANESMLGIGSSNQD